MKFVSLVLAPIKVEVSLKVRLCVINGHGELRERPMETFGSPPGRQLSGITDDPDFDLTAWPTPDEGALSEKALDNYLRRKRGVNLYFEGASGKTILDQIQLSRKQIYRLIRERCMKTHPDGRIYRWRGLLKSVRINGFQRKTMVRTESGGAGRPVLLTMFF